LEVFLHSRYQDKRALRQISSSQWLRPTVDGPIQPPTKPILTLKEICLAKLRARAAEPEDPPTS